MSQPNPEAEFVAVHDGPLNFDRPLTPEQYVVVETAFRELLRERLKSMFPDAEVAIVLQRAGARTTRPTYESDGFEDPEVENIVTRTRTDVARDVDGILQRGSAGVHVRSVERVEEDILELDMELERLRDYRQRLLQERVDAAHYWERQRAEDAHTKLRQVNLRADMGRVMETVVFEATRWEPLPAGRRCFVGGRLSNGPWLVVWELTEYRGHRYAGVIGGSAPPIVTNAFVHEYEVSGRELGPVQRKKLEGTVAS